MCPNLKKGVFFCESVVILSSMILILGEVKRSVMAEGDSLTLPAAQIHQTRSVQVLERLALQSSPVEMRSLLLMDLEDSGVDCIHDGVC